MAETGGRNRRDYSKTELIFGNLLIILWIGLGALSCALFYPLNAILFFGLAAFLVFYELGKHGCEHVTSAKPALLAWESCLTFFSDRPALQTLTDGL